MSYIEESLFVLAVLLAGSPPACHFHAVFRRHRKLLTFHLIIPPYCRSQCQSSSSAATGTERREKAVAAAEALHVWWNVDQENNGVTCAVIRRRLLMFQFLIRQNAGGVAMMRAAPPPRAANGSCPWQWMCLRQFLGTQEAEPSKQEGAPLWGRGFSLVRQQCSA